MGLFSRANKTSVPVVEERSIGDWVANGQYSNSGFICTIAAVFNAISLISNSIAELPIRVKVDGEEDLAHPYNNLFTTANVSKFHLMKTAVVDAIIQGDGYIYIERGTNGVPSKLIYCPHGQVTHYYNELNGEEYFTCTRVSKDRIDPKDMVHLMINTRNGVEGKPITFYGKPLFDLAKYCNSAASDFFSSGMNLSGILTVAGNPSQDEITNIRNNWRQMRAGDSKSGLAILRGNMAYQSVGQNAADSQLLETRLFNVQEIARVFGISPALLGDLSHSTYNSIEQSQMEFLQHTLLPYITMIESELNRKLCSGSNVSIDLDESYILRTDKQATANYCATLVNSGICSRNEARKLLGLAPIEGADILTVSFTDISQNTIGKSDTSDEGDDNQ